MKRLNRKGQVMQNIGALGVGVAALSLILVITFLVMGQLRTQTISQSSTTTFIGNETITLWEDDTAFDLETACMDISCVVLYNDSDYGAEVSTAGYTCDVAGDTEAQITIDNQSIWSSGNVTTMYLNYSCTPPSTAFNATGTLTNATQSIPGWIPLIILVMIGGIILGLVSAFKKNE